MKHCGQPEEDQASQTIVAYVDDGCTAVLSQRLMKLVVQRDQEHHCKTSDFRFESGAPIHLDCAVGKDREDKILGHVAQLANSEMPEFNAVGGDGREKE